MKYLLKPIFSYILLWGFLLPMSNQDLIAQTCSAVVSNGQNLVTNGDFSQAYTSWTYTSPDYTEFTPCGSSCYSVPGKIFAGNNSIDFNQAFNMGAGVPIPDHTGTADNMMLMVDGVCNTGIKLWSQSGIPIAANTNYYFSVWITTLSNTTPRGTLQFDINGTNFPTTITSVGTVGTWTQYTYLWTSGPTPPATATISIENTTTSGCNSAVDFAIDDISFSPGCDFGSPGPTPNLGPDFTICGKTLPFNINPNFSAAVAAQANINYTWYRNGVVQAANSGMGPTKYNFPVSSAGTYAVCVQEGGNCPKTDIIVVTSTFSINLGPPVTLCDPVTAVLDAGYSGPGVQYRWYRGYPTRAGGNDSSQTLNVSIAGTYRVDVTDPICGTQSGTIVVNSNAATPNNATYCTATSTTVSVTGPGKYKWWSAPAGGTKLATGPSYLRTGLTPPTNYTFYVEDTSTFSLTAGPSATANNPSSGSSFGSFINPYGINAGSSNGLLIFNAIVDFRIDTISVLVNNYYCPTPGASNDQVIIEVRYPASLGGGHVPGSPRTVSSPCTYQNNGGIPARIMKIPLGFDLLQANGYQMKLAAGSPSTIIGFLNATNGGTLPTPVRYAYPTIYNYAGNPVVEFASNSASDFNLYYSPTAFPGYFDWKITKGINCDRVPVTITYDCPLPVEYIDFEVSAQSSASAQVNWKTIHESNVDFFVVERSYDGTNFMEIATVQAKGNSSSSQSYSITDYGLSSGIVYYRIAQYDLDGQIRYTEIKTIQIYAGKMFLFPNPTSDNVNLSLQGTSSGKMIYVEMLNSIGQTLIRYEAVGTSDIFENELNTTGLSPGVYFVKVQSENNRWMEKLVKE